MNQGIIDAICPMTYWAINSGACTDWAANLDFFKSKITRPGRQLIMGMHAYDPNTSGTVDFTKLRPRVDYARQQGIPGTIIFAANYLGSTWSDFSDTTKGYPYGPYSTVVAPTPLSLPRQ
jgi:hypothetical protein